MKRYLIDHILLATILVAITVIGVVAWAVGY